MKQLMEFLLRRKSYERGNDRIHRCCDNVHVFFVAGPFDIMISDFIKEDDL